MKTCCFTSILLLAASPALFAQRATVQQPVIRNFSVNTTVSAPDRGSALLGSVSRGGMTRKSFGPGRFGSSYGKFLEHSAVSVHPTIHDFESMDRFLLNQDQPATNSLTGRTGSAYSQLSHRAFPGSRQAYPVSRNIPTAAAGPAKTATRSLQLGLKAEKKGKLSLAKLHYRMAAKKGSTTAAEHLTRLKKAKQTSIASRK